ncbi:WbqC family protein [Thermodesulfobacteriota bacterium]
MIISANQPYFAPFLGFFYKALRSDVLVLLDDVQFPRGTTWITRNRFKGDQGTLWMTIPVWKKGLGLQKINEVKICHEGRWAKKHMESLKKSYGKAPYFPDHLNFFQEIFSSGIEKVFDLNLEIIKYLFAALGIDTRIILQSELEIVAKGNRLLAELCRNLNATRYLAQHTAGKYLETDLFQEAEIRIEFFKPPSPIYPQLWGDFIPNLSAFDLLFNCGPKSRDILTRKLH